MVFLWAGDDFVTNIKDIRVFDRETLRYDVLELDIDVENGTLDVHIAPPSICLKEFIETWPDRERIEEGIKNLLNIEGINCHKVRYFSVTNVIYLQLNSSTATIQIADLLHIPEEAITPFWRGCAIINTGMI